MVLLSFVVVVINQTAGVVQLAKEVIPTLGTATLWGLLIAYGGLIGVPVVIVMRMPRPLVPPQARPGPSSTIISSDWASGSRPTRGSSSRPIRPTDRRSIDDALQVLDQEADAIVKQMATTVF